MNMAVKCGQHNVSDFSCICLVNEDFCFCVTFQPALFENIVSETVQHLQEIIRPKGGEEKVGHTCRGHQGGGSTLEKSWIR